MYRAAGVDRAQGEVAGAVGAQSIVGREPLGGGRVYVGVERVGTGGEPEPGARCQSRREDGGIAGDVLDETCRGLGQAAGAPGATSAAKSAKISAKISAKKSGENRRYEPIPDGPTLHKYPARGHYLSPDERSRSDL